MLILASGVDFETAFSSVGACLNNLGPGLGAVSENYSSINTLSKTVFWHLQCFLVDLKYLLYW